MEAKPVYLTEDEAGSLVYCLRSTIHHEPGLGEVELNRLRFLDDWIRNLFPTIPEAV
jgi:hypothetical protein